MNFIENVNREKKKRAMTSAELAELCGVPLSTLNKLLSGVIDEPKLSVALAISEALGVSLGELCGEREDVFSDEERELIFAFRELGAHDRELVRMITFKPERAEPQTHTSRARILPTAKVGAKASEERKVSIPLYNLPVSAGAGMFLDDTACENIDIPLSAIDTGADFALRISGDSMSPKYHDGDILMVEKCTGTQVRAVNVYIDSLLID